MARSKSGPTAFLFALLLSLCAASEAQQAPPPGWNTQLGVGLIANPEFQGSEDYRLIPHSLLRRPLSRRTR